MPRDNTIPDRVIGRGRERPGNLLGAFENLMNNQPDVFATLLKRQLDQRQAESDLPAIEKERIQRSETEAKRKALEKIVSQFNEIERRW